MSICKKKINKQITNLYVEQINFSNINSNFSYFNRISFTVLTITEIFLRTSFLLQFIIDKFNFKNVA